MGGRGDDGPALIYFFLQLLPGNTNDLEDYLSLIEDRVAPVVESIPGVSRVQMQGGAAAEKQLQIVIDPFQAAQLGIQLPDIATAIQGFNDVSGGTIDAGRRKYTLRYSGRYSPEELKYLILDWRNGSPIRLGDVASVAIASPDNNFFAIQNGNPAVSIRIDKENDANTLRTLVAVKKEVEHINEELLKPRQLTMAQSFDASVFIYRAINLVTSNLFLGIFCH